MIGWLMHLLGRKPSPKPTSGPSPEELELKAARTESSLAREYARETVKKGREEMTWLEVALMPINTPSQSRHQPEKGAHS